MTGQTAWAPPALAAAAAAASPAAAAQSTAAAMQPMAAASDRDMAEEPTPAPTPGPSFQELREALYRDLMRQLRIDFERGG